MSRARARAGGPGQVPGRTCEPGLSPGAWPGWGQPGQQPPGGKRPEQIPEIEELMRKGRDWLATKGEAITGRKQGERDGE